MDLAAFKISGGVFMKKLLVLLAALTLVTGFAFSQDLGLTAGLEFGINAVNKPNDASDMYPYIMPNIAYENSFGGVDLYTEVDYTLGFTKDSDDTYPMDLYWDLALGYDISLASASTLSILAENELGFNFVTDLGDTLWGTFRPGLKFDQGIDGVGDLYAQFDLPIGYGKGWGDDTIICLDGTIGWDSTFGLGLKAKAHFLFAPDSLDTGFTGIDIKATYSNGPAYGEIEARIAKDSGDISSFIDGSGYKPSVAIIPKVQYEIITGLNAYLKCAFGNIGGTGDIIISPVIGVTYSF